MSKQKPQDKIRPAKKHPDKGVQAIIDARLQDAIKQYKL